MSNNEKAIKTLEEQDRIDELNRDCIGGARIVFFIALTIFIIICGVIWFAVYTFRSHQIDAYVADLDVAVSDDELEAEEVVDISLVKVVVDEKTYTIPEFLELDEIPTVVDVMIMYSDSDVQTKSAYVSYVDDSEDVEYIDGTYGRLLVPQEYNKTVE